MCNQLTRCWAEIDTQAIASNFQLLKTIGPKIMAVVKADAYGHDVDIVAPILQQLGVEHYAVATVDEGAELRELVGFDNQAIYLMAAVLGEEASRIVDLGLIPFATDTDFVEQLSIAAQKKGKTADIHLEVDTGIGRAGVPPESVLQTLLKWKSLPGIRITGICTHFTAADSIDTSDSRQQLQLFQDLLAELPSELLDGLAIHAANSPASLRLPIGNSSFFRPGLLLYGISPSSNFVEGFPYKPVMSLKAKVLLVRRLPEGSDISYSRTYKLPHDAVIATVGIGYGDGYPRRLSNIGSVLLADGAAAPIRGRVCMDQICIEASEYANLIPGDIVTIIGSAADSKINATQIAELIDTTPHEITTCLTGRVKRVSV